ncbi:MAG TPA: ATP-binding protein [Polyangiaceae bacterium]|nr:ATP-binding protein [Polyangiaceae bacterium]
MRNVAVAGRIQHRLALAIVLTALIPVLVAMWMAQNTVRQTAARFYIPEVGMHLDRSLDLYKELARSVKALMREEAAAIAERHRLREAVRLRDSAAMQQELTRAFGEHPSLVSLSIRDADGNELSRVQRPKPLDPAREKDLEVERSLREADDGEMLMAVFATPRDRFDELSEMNQFVDTYRKLEHRREADERSYVLAFAVLLGITIVAAIGVGVLLARSVSGRIGELAIATKWVAEGDLTIRVPERGKDELSDLARAFNRMLGEVTESRSRIEYLQRIGAWQEMARRLAHEIKNPLTPIQLAVQEIHRRYTGSDPAFRRLLDTTLEIVEDEVGTLRRLVSEFSNFARLPQAKLEPADLADFLRELATQLRIEDRDADLPEDLRACLQGTHIHLDFEVPEEAAEVLMDRQMLRRVLMNLIQNAAQALRDTREDAARIRVRLARDGDFYVVDVEDTGPGIPETLGERIFDPYVTSKPDGTGLGLAIVKKITMEHGGRISASTSDLGGARLRVRLPALGTRAAALASATSLERSGEFARAALMR